MHDRAARFIVWGTWAVMTAAALGLVAGFGVNLPFWDEWDTIVPFVTGQKPVTLQTLWEPNNNHHLVIPKIVLLGLDRLCGHDVRAGMVVNVAILSAAAAMMIVAVGRARGCLKWSDILLPVAALNWGHAENFLWSIQMGYALVAFFACGMLSLIVTTRDNLTVGKFSLLGVGLLAMPLCQAAGVAMAACLAFWPGFLSVINWRCGTSRSRLFAVAAAAMSLTIVAVAAGCYVAPLDQLRPDPHPRHFLWNSMRMFALTCYSPGQTMHPIFPIITAGVLLMSFTLLFYVWWRQPEERLRASGLVLFLVAILGTGIGIAWGRHGSLQERYLTLLFPALCGVYFVWTLYGRQFGRPEMSSVLCVVLLVFCPARTWKGYEWARKHAQQAETFEHDLLYGMPVSELARRNTEFLYPNKVFLEQALREMHDAQIGIFRFVNTENPKQDALKAE